jgi:hypothetical protein
VPRPPLSILRGSFGLLLAAALSGCGRGDADFGLPKGVSGLPATTVAAASGLGPEEEAALMSLADALGLAGGSTLGEPGIAYAQASGLRVGWKDLAGSPNFRAAWSARPSGDRLPGWLFADLQLAVDLLLDVSQDGAVRSLVEPLGLGSLEWAVFSFSRVGSALEVDGRVRVGEDPVSLARALSGRAGPSLLGAAPEDALMRAELRCDAEVLGRMLDAGTAPGALGAGLAARGAMVGLVGQLVRTLVREVDGTVSLAVFADETVCAAVGVREPDDVRDLLDMYFKPTEPDVWEGPAGARFEVVGQALRVATRPWPEAQPTAGPDFGPGLHIEGLLGAALAELDPGRRVRVDVSPADASTLSVSVRPLD